jgi:dipeptidyl aminopeptidase/acylaminoacyl peptidase
MRAAMRAAGKEPEYVVYIGEGHGFLKMENRLDFYTRMEKFLAEHIGN